MAARHRKQSGGVPWRAYEQQLPLGPDVRRVKVDFTRACAAERVDVQPFEREIAQRGKWRLRSCLPC